MRMSKPFRRFVAATLVGLMGLAIEGGMARAGELTRGGWKMTFPDTVKLEEGGKDPKTLRLKTTLTFKDLNRINIKFEPINVNGTFGTKEDAEELKQVREEVPKEYVNVEATIDNQSKKPWDMLTFRLTDAFDCPRTYLSGPLFPCSKPWPVTDGFTLIAVTWEQNSDDGSPIQIGPGSLLPALARFL